MARRNAQAVINMKTILVIITILFSPVMADDNAGKCLFMPDELVELANSIGFEQFSNFYSELGMVYGPPFVYGYISNLPSENSVVFWCEDTSKSVSIFQKNILVFAERDSEWDAFQIKDIIRLSILGGLTLKRDSVSSLNDFQYSDSVDTPGPKGVPLEDYIIEVYYDGNTTQFYRFQENTFIRPDSGC